MQEDELIKMNMLIHGHDYVTEVLKLDEKLIDLAVLFAMNDSYEDTGFKDTYVKPKRALSDARVFLKEKFILHKISYTDELMLKLRLNGRIVRDSQDLLKLYNKVGLNIKPFKLPVKFVSEPYYYGNTVLLTNISDDEDFLRGMNIFFKRIELGEKTNSFTSVCYVHEIIHTQIESLKGIVRDYYNSELLSIFLELVYSFEQGEILLRENIKIRIHLFLIEFNRLSKYYLNSKEYGDKWNVIVSGKYIVSTLKAFNLFSKYYLGSDLDKKYILELVQSVLDGNCCLEEILNVMDIMYDKVNENEAIIKLVFK